MRFLSAVRSVSLALILSACGGRVAMPENAPSSAEALISPLAERSVQSLSAALHVDAWQGNERVKFQQLCAVQAPGKLRLDILSPFGQPLSAMVSDGETLSIYDQRSRRFLQGDATSENFAILLPIGLDPAELSALMRGEVPVLNGEEKRLSWDDKNGRYVVEIKKESVFQKLLIEPKRGLVTESTVSDEQGVRYHAILAQYTSGDKPLPQLMKFEAPARQGRARIEAEIELEDIRVDIDLNDAVFVLEPPRGIEVETF